MTTDAPARIATPELVRQLVAGVRGQLAGRSHAEPLVIGARANPQWDRGIVGDESTGPIVVAPCSTPLAVRAALADFHDSHGADSTLVVLTHLPDRELGQDLLGRFVTPRLLELSPWDAVRLRFSVRQLDPLFSEHLYSWMASPLLEVDQSAIPSGAGILTVDSALKAVAEAVLGAKEPSTERLLVASAQSGFAARVERGDPIVVDRLCQTLSYRLGPTGSS